MANNADELAWIAGILRNPQNFNAANVFPGFQNLGPGEFDPYIQQRFAQPERNKMLDLLTLLAPSNRMGMKESRRRNDLITLLGLEGVVENAPYVGV